MRASPTMTKFQRDAETTYYIMLTCIPELYHIASHHITLNCTSVAHHISSHYNILKSIPVLHDTSLHYIITLHLLQLITAADILKIASLDIRC